MHPWLRRQFLHHRRRLLTCRLHLLHPGRRRQRSSRHRRRHQLRHPPSSIRSWEGNSSPCSACRGHPHRRGSSPEAFPPVADPVAPPVAVQSALLLGPSVAASVIRHGGSIPACRAPIRGGPRPSAPVARRARTSVRGHPHAVHARLRLSAAARASARTSAHPRSFVHLLPPVGGSSSPIAACCHGSPPPRPLISLLLPLGLEQQRSVVYAAPRGQDSLVRATRGLICTGKQVLVAG